MHESFIPINDVPTHIMTWGPWIEESFARKEVVIVITGNPGLVGYYSRFCATVHEQLGDDIPVWVIGHAGHDEPPQGVGRKVLPLKGNESLYDLDAQVKHKVDFIRRYVPDDVKIHLFGHSIGAWIVLELLKVPEVRSKIQHSYLLYPTIERMSDTFPGHILTRCIFPLWFVLRLFIILFNAFPPVVGAFLVSVYFSLVSIPRHFVGTTLKYLRLSILEQILFLADDEMKRVREPDVATLAANKDRLKLFYGRTDGWTPAKYVAEMKQRVVGLDVEIAPDGFRHAFVLQKSEEMGRLVAGWIAERRAGPHGL